MSTKRRALLESVNGIEDKKQRLGALSELLQAKEELWQQTAQMWKQTAQTAKVHEEATAKAQEELWKQTAQTAKAMKQVVEAEKALRRNREAEVAALSVELAKHKATFVIRPLIEHGLRHWQQEKGLEQESLSMTMLSERFLSEQVFEAPDSWEL